MHTTPEETYRSSDWPDGRMTVKTVMTIKDLIDNALEITVVPSFSRIGYAVRSRLFDWTPLSATSLEGRTVLVTGPTSGLGRATAEALAGLGARLLLVGRDASRLAKVRDDLIAEHGEDRFRTVVADMASLGSIHAAAERIFETEPRLDVLIDNAGAIFGERTESPDSLESTLATLVVGPFALVTALMPLLRQTGAARVVAVTSGGMYVQKLDLDDLQWERRAFDGPRAYAQAKRAQVALIREWARRIPAGEVTFNAMHPGWADTPGISAALPAFYGLMDPILRSPAEGADTAVWLAADQAPAGVTGRVFLDRRVRPFDRVPCTRVSAAGRRDLWDQVTDLAGSGRPRDLVPSISSPDRQRHGVNT
jgi:dehydrogenase/reductase SDR family member 12